jgi:hypothetical protein
MRFEVHVFIHSPQEDAIAVALAKLVTGVDKLLERDRAAEAQDALAGNIAKGLNKGAGDLTGAVQGTETESPAAAG